MKPTLVVMAAGMGSRYGGLKQVDSVGPSGEVIMDYSIFDANRASFGKVVFIIRKDIEKEFKEKVGAKYEELIPVEYAFQELDMIPKGFTVPEGRTKPWGTAHAVLTSKLVVNEPFAVINADDFYGRSSYAQLSNYLQKTTDNNYAMIGFKVKNTLSEYGSVARGICSCDKNGYLIDVVERTKITKQNTNIIYYDDKGAQIPISGDTLVSLNCWGFTRSFFKELDNLFIDFLSEYKEDAKAEFFIPSVVDTLIKKNKVKIKVLPTEDSWFGITYREDKPLVVEKIKELVENGVYPEKLF